MTKHLLLLAALMPTLATAQIPGVAVGHSTIIKGEGRWSPLS